MDGLYDTLRFCYENFYVGFKDTRFLADLLFVNKMSPFVFCGDGNYPVDFYLCMLCAGVDEDICFPSAESSKFISDFVDKIDHCLTKFDPCIAVCCGEYELADRLINIVDTRIYSSLVESECWDYIDRITDFGKNKRHTEIITRLLVKDYLNGSDNIFKYIARYNKSELLTCGEALNIALLEINSADELFKKILSEVRKIMSSEELLNSKVSNSKKKRFNERSIDLMKRCAELGMTLKEFRSFNRIVLPIFYKTDFLDFDGNPQVGYERIKLPRILTKLIDKNTVVYNSEYDEMLDYFVDTLLGRDLIPLEICEFENDEADNLSTPKYMNELGYICIDFNKRYGSRLVINVDSVEVFSGIKRIPKNLFEIRLQGGVLEEFYKKINVLKGALNYGILSQKNVDEITAYFVSKINSSNGKDCAFAIKRLRQLNDKLIKMGGKVQ